MRSRRPGKSSRTSRCSGSWALSTALEGNAITASARDNPQGQVARGHRGRRSGRDFLTPEIAEVARARVAEGAGAVELGRVPHGPWLPDTDARVEAVEHNQLWRDHLLAVAIRHQARSPYAASRLLVVHHPEDRRCALVYAGYRALLRDGDDTVSCIALDGLVDAWSPLVEHSARAAWREPFRTRYLDLEPSAS